MKLLPVSFLWVIFIFSFITAFFIYVNNLTFTTFSGCTSRVSWMVAMPVFPRSAIYSLTPFTFNSNLQVILYSILSVSVLFFFFYLMFVYFWERDRAQAGEGQRGGRHRIWSRLWAVSPEPDAGLELTDCEIMNWAKGRRLTNWATQVPLFYFNSNIVLVADLPESYIVIQPWIILYKASWG